MREASIGEGRYSMSNVQMHMRKIQDVKHNPNRRKLGMNVWVIIRLRRSISNAMRKTPHSCIQAAIERPALGNSLILVLCAPWIGCGSGSVELSILVAFQASNAVGEQSWKATGTSDTMTRTLTLVQRR